MTKFFLILYLSSFCFLSELLADDEPLKGYTISGHVRDSLSGEELIGANVYIRSTGQGTVTNIYGFYSISLSPGMYTIGFSYVGYRSLEFSLSLSESVTMNIELAPLAEELEEVVISTTRKNDNISSLEMSTNRLPIQSIRRIPAFMGEVDVIKAIQLLPGVQSASEGSSGFSVRGGSTDQNLILLDEATIYNASHLLGFFSVFNNDAIKEVKLYKGDIPATHGGRLSSLLDIRMKDGNMKQFSGTGGIGTISSRLTLEGPVFKDKTSFLVSGRRTYADIFLPLARNEDIRDNRLYFYDLNVKLNHIINDNNRLFISGYFGRDIFTNQFAGMNFGNNALTFRWNHLFSSRLFSNFSLVRSAYNYELGTPEGQANAFSWNSDLQNYGFKSDFSWFISPGRTLKFGASSTYYFLSPGTARGVGEETIFTSFKVPSAYSLEHGIYIMQEEQISDRFALKFGLRISGFQNIGEAVVYTYDEDYSVSDSTIYKKGKFYNQYFSLEPRLGLNYTLNDNNSIKGSYSRTSQYIQLAQNSTAGTPLDVWFTASPNVLPQVSDQFSIGFFRNFRDHTIESSVEAYYKNMQNTIDFRDHAQLLLNPALEGELRTGNAWSYGLEFLVKLTDKKLNGWISYTWSKTWRRITGINNDLRYPAPYDKPHDLSIVLNYQMSEQWSFGTNWVYSNGLPYTFPTGRYEILGKILPVYSDRNSYRFDNYHRMDMSVNFTPKKKPGKKWFGEWNLSVYNVYGRKNTWAINFIQDDEDPAKTFAEKTYLFSIIPAITYNFNF